MAVKCLEEVTPQLGLQYLDNFGFTTLAHGTEADRDANGTVWTDANLPLALGGLTHGVTNVELCAAYAAIATVVIILNQSIIQRFWIIMEMS